MNDSEVPFGFRRELYATSKMAGHHQIHYKLTTFEGDEHSIRGLEGFETLAVRTPVVLLPTASGTSIPLHTISPATSFDFRVRPDSITFPNTTRGESDSRTRKSRRSAFLEKASVIGRRIKTTIEERSISSHPTLDRYGVLSSAIERLQQNGAGHSIRDIAQQIIDSPDLFATVSGGVYDFVQNTLRPTYSHRTIDISVEIDPYNTTDLPPPDLPPSPFFLRIFRTADLNSGQLFQKANTLGEYTTKRSSMLEAMAAATAGAQQMECSLQAGVLVALQNLVYTVDLGISIADIKAEIKRLTKLEKLKLPSGTYGLIAVKTFAATMSATEDKYQNRTWASYEYRTVQIPGRAAHTAVFLRNN